MKKNNVECKLLHSNILLHIFPASVVKLVISEYYERLMKETAQQEKREAAIKKRKRQKRLRDVEPN